MQLTEAQVEAASWWLALPFRRADVEVVVMLGGTTEVLAEYIWDHWLGEPEDTTANEIEYKIVQGVYAGLAVEWSLLSRRRTQLRDGDSRRIVIDAALDDLARRMVPVEAELERLDPIEASS